MKNQMNFPVFEADKRWFGIFRAKSMSWIGIGNLPDLDNFWTGKFYINFIRGIN